MSCRLSTWEEWARIVQSCDVATFFQTHHWARILTTVYPSMEARGTIHVLRGGREALFPAVAVSGRRFFPRLESMPMGGYGGPVGSAPLSPDDLETIRREAQTSWVRGITVYPDPASGLDLDKWGSAVPFYTHLLSLEGGFGEVWSSRFDRKARNQVRKSERVGVELDLAQTTSEWLEFATLYRRKASAWSWPGYHEEIFAHLSERQVPEVRLWVARKRGELLSGLVVLSWGYQATPWASAMEDGAGPLCPNHALYRAAVEEACREGRRWFNFGSSREMTRLHMFKESFGARRVDYHYYGWEPAWKSWLRRVRRSRGARERGRCGTSE
jgi:hypothetical protein